MQSDYSWQPRTTLTFKKQPSSKPKMLLILVIVLVALFFILTRPFSGMKSPLAKEKTTNSKQNTTLSTSTNLKLTTNEEWKVLQEKIEQEIAPLGGTFAVLVYDIKNEKEFSMNGETIFIAASVNKIPILAALYNLVGQGKVDLEKTVTLQQQDVQDYGTGSIRYDPIGTQYSIKTLARLMMEKSDNTAAYILANYIVGLETLQNMMNSWNLTQTDIQNNKTSAKDMRILLVKMFKGEVTTPALTSEMLGFMDESDFDDRLPKLLPSDIKIYHKTGDEVGKIHDVGIVDLKNRPYFIGVLSTDMTEEQTTKDMIGKISKMVYDAIKS